MSHAPVAHADHDEHAFTGEPITELPADEPRTPTWLPALGLVVFTAGAVALMVGGDDPKEAPKPQAAQAAQVVPAAAAPGAPGGAAPQLTPEQQAMLRRVAAQQQAPGAAPPGAAPSGTLPTVRRIPAAGH